MTTEVKPQEGGSQEMQQMQNQAPMPQGAVAPVAGGVPFQSASLYVGDLHPDVTEALLFDIFNAVGPVASIRVCRDAVTRRSLGYAYVNFHAGADAERALDTMNYTLIKNRPCRMMWSQRDPALRKSSAGNVFVKHLDLSIDNKALYDTFSLFGNILSCKVVTDDKGKSRGYGFVHFETTEAADEAIKKINGMLLAGKEVFVGKFLKKNDRPGTKDWTNLYVKNLPQEWKKDDLEEAFAKFGPIASCIVMEDSEGNSRCFGFVDFCEHKDAASATEEMNGFDPIKGEKIDLSLYEKENQNDDNKESGDEEQEKAEKEDDKESQPKSPSHNALLVCRAQKKNEREKELMKKFEQLKLERQSKYQGVNLYIKNLDDRVDEETLKKEFEAHGDITSAKVMVDKSGVSRGFGFVCFSSPEEAVKAVSEMNGKLIMGKPIYVALAQRKDQRRAQLEVQHRQQQRMMNVPGLGPQQMFPYPGMGMQQPQFQSRQAQMQMMNMMRQMPPRGMQQQFPRPAMQYTANARNTQMPQPGMPGQMGMRSMGQDMPLSAEVLAQASQSQRKNMIGEKLFPLVGKLQPQYAAKITGMLLEIDNNELLVLLENPEALQAKVSEAMDVLQKANFGNRR